MNARTLQILEEALTLPADERDALARELLESVDEANPEIEQAWADVIARRARGALDGTAPTRDLDAALDGIEARARARAR